MEKYIPLLIIIHHIHIIRIRSVVKGYIRGKRIRKSECYFGARFALGIDSRG